MTDLPLALFVLRTGLVPIQTPAFCLFWPIYNYGFCGVDLMLMAFGCCERYLLIFHQVFFKKHLILFHYGPIVFLLIYPFLLYMGLIVIHPCVNAFDYTKFVCGGPCYQFEVGFST